MRVFGVGFSHVCRVFESRINKNIQLADAGYDNMRFRDALQFSFYQMQLDRDSYRDMCTKMDMVCSNARMRT